MEIGDGSNINVWTAPWIRNTPSHKPSSPPPPFLEDLTVNQLMNSDFLSWNQMLINSLFNQQDAAAVTSIPLFNHTLTDTRI